MEGISKYLVGVKTTGDEHSYTILSSLSNDELKAHLNDKNWLYKIVELVNSNLNEYKILNTKCLTMDLFDKEFESIIQKMRELEVDSIHLSDYVKMLESESPTV